MTWESRVVNSCLALTGVLLALASAEVALVVTGSPAAHDRKAIFSIPPDFGHCYSSDPGGYWPISLRSRPQDLLSLGQFLPRSVTDRLVAETPHCILYDVDKRQRGYFSERADQVALVGDSFCFGEGLRGEDTLGYLLGLRYPEANFPNLGWPGADIEQVARVVSRAIDEIPHLTGIVYFYNLNDLPAEHNLMVRISRVNDLQNLRWNSGRASATAGDSLLWKSRLYRLTVHAWTRTRETARSIREYQTMYLGSGARAGVLSMRRQLRAMADAAQAAGIRLTVVAYPLLYKDLAGHYPFQGIHALLREECRSLGIGFVDALPAFDRHRSMRSLTVHEIDFHPNGNANRLVADYLSAKDRLGVGTAAAVISR